MSISHIGHYINGQVAAGTSGRSQPVTNPATGAVTGSVALANRYPLSLHAALPIRKSVV